MVYIAIACFNNQPNDDFQKLFDRMASLHQFRIASLHQLVVLFVHYFINSSVS